MSKIATFVLSVVLSVGAVANAEPVNAPRQVEVHQVMPDKSLLSVFVPQVDPIVEARNIERETVIQNATLVGDCPEWAGLAFDIGWPSDQIPRLLAIIHRESRCNPQACSQSDSGRVCRDWGLMQINEYSWRSTIRKQGWTMKEMWNPETNLRFALWLYQYSLERNGDGWQPWKLQ